MQLLITASKDTYITDKIIDNSYRSKNSNVGHAATLDLFKLHEESGILENGSFVVSGVKEKSVILVKFDYDKIGDLTSSILNLGSANFKAQIELTDVSSGLQKPFNFSAICNPLVNSFEEGYGMDVNGFNDLGSANYLTSSFTTDTATLWKSEGAAAGGGSGQVKATGSVTVANHAGLDNTATFQLSDGTNTVTFTANTAANTPTRTNATNFTFGINGATDNPTVADRIFAAIAAAKTGQGGTPDLNITATNPGDGAIVNLTQDSFGPTGNTDITLGGTATGRLTFSNLRGGYDTSHLDYFNSGSLDGSFVDFGSSKYLSNPNDNLVLDVTTAVKAAVKGTIPNHGFRVGFSGSYDSDSKTRFVKRFASRHVKNKHLVPKLRVFFNDELSDDSDKAYAGKAFNLILRSQQGLAFTNLLDNSAAALTGDNCGKIIISSGSYSQSVNFSQVNLSSNNTRLKGTYKATVTIPNNNVLVKRALLADSTGFYVDIKWMTSDESVTFSTKRIKIRGNDYESFNVSDISINFQNRKAEYLGREDIEILVSAIVNSSSYSSSKIPKNPDTFQGDLHYRILDSLSREVIIDYDFDNLSTRMNIQNNAFKAQIKSGTLVPGHTYELELSSLINDNKVQFNDTFRFKVL